MIELIQVSEMTRDCSAKFYLYMPITYSVNVLIKIPNRLVRCVEEATKDGK